MNTSALSRRSFLMTTAATATLLPFAREYAFSQTASSAGWFEMVKEQHVKIIAQLSIIADLLPLPPGKLSELIPQLKVLSYLLTAHSVAEENVLYPALAIHGLPVDSGDLYLEQQFQKIWNSEIDSLAIHSGWDGPNLEAKFKKLQVAILEHALDHEEGEYYPKLLKLLTPQQSEELTTDYAAAYAMVIPGKT